MTLAIPAIPAIPAGLVIDASQLNDLSYACTFLMGKPIARVNDTAGGQAVTATAAAVSFTTKNFDSDGMWNSSSPTILTVQTSGWYKVRYGIELDTGSIAINTYIQQTAGPNNTLAPGTIVGPYWPGYAVQSSSVAIAGCSGVWPVFLHMGDYLSVYVKASGTGASLGITEGGSYFSLEYASA